MVESREAVPILNALSREDARAALTRCCGATRWVEGMLARLPFASHTAMYAAAVEVWAQLGPDDYREAFSHHPEIGANIDELRRKFATTADWSRAEQSAALGASEATLLALRDGNRAYRERFGFSFIVCATGKGADEMLALLQTRLKHSPDLELDIAATEQAKITHLRLEKLEA
ncbi:MAG TPA: 2-oxo-4-hydroxy-4-carboxy-5-ureidoimidazoline decarboxylase [Polyangiaceae bacterium]|nr:2-oxo-4-hydroxy-4-carboxy-5-ureidoimidazoline decarboxylase [Polyangiaceae bacterium]